MQQPCCGLQPLLAPLRNISTHLSASSGLRPFPSPLLLRENDCRISVKKKKFTRAWSSECHHKNSNTKAYLTKQGNGTLLWILPVRRLSVRSNWNTCSKNKPEVVDSLISSLIIFRKKHFRVLPTITYQFYIKKFWLDVLSEKLKFNKRMI